MGVNNKDGGLFTRLGITSTFHKREYPKRISLAVNV